MTKTFEQEAFIEAVSHSTRNIMLNAVAGSGKTTTNIWAVRGYLQENPNHSVLMVAFNKDIANEFEDRKHPTKKDGSKRDPEDVLPQSVMCKTLHATGLAAWKSWIGGRTQVDFRKTYKIVNDIRDDFFERDDEIPSDIYRLIGIAKNSGMAMQSREPVLSLIPDNQETWMDIIEEYDFDLEGMEYECIQLARRALEISIDHADNGVIDFDDMLYMPTCYAKPRCFTKYNLVIIDEAQDISPIQRHMLSASMADMGRIVATGDPYQAIYAFRGADSSSMRLMKQEFAMEEYPLTFSWRCAASVIEKAQTWVPHIQARPNAPEGTTMGLDNWHLDMILDDDVIICRNNAPLVDMAVRLLANGRRARILGKDISGSLNGLLRRAQITRLEELPGCLESYQMTMLNRFQRSGKQHKIEALMDSIRMIMVIYENLPPSSKLKDLTSQISKLFTAEREARCITLCSGHKSKGLEFNRVWALDFESLIPSRWATTEAAIQQEHNLAYVITTRAINELFFVSSEGFSVKPLESEDDED